MVRINLSADFQWQKTFFKPLIIRKNSFSSRNYHLVAIEQLLTGTNYRLNYFVINHLVHINLCEFLSDKTRFSSRYLSYFFSFSGRNYPPVATNALSTSTFVALFCSLSICANLLMTKPEFQSVNDAFYWSFIMNYSFRRKNPILFIDF